MLAVDVNMKDADSSPLQ